MCVMYVMHEKQENLMKNGRIKLRCKKTSNVAFHQKRQKRSERFKLRSCWTNNQEKLDKIKS